MNRIEISAPHINRKEALANIAEAIEKGQIAQGPQVRMAELAIADAFDALHASLLNSGTASLRAALISSVAVKQGIDKTVIDRHMHQSEVIVPAFSFNATLNTVLQTGATAHVVDITRGDFGIDEARVVEAMDDATVGVMPVDLYGQAAGITNQHSLYEGVAVVRDAAQAHGALIHGESLTHHGDAVSLSFYPTKNIAAPEGGAVLTDLPDVDEIVRIYRNQGMAARYVYEMSGDNLRMSDVHAAILRANLGSLALVTARRRQNAASMTERLGGIDGLTLPREMPDRTHVWHQYTVMVEDDFGMGRDELAARLNEGGIGTGIYYPKTMVDHPTFRDHPKIKLAPTPVAEEVAGRVLSLPIHPGVSEQDIDRIGETIEKIREAA